MKLYSTIIFLIMTSSIYAQSTSDLIFGDMSIDTVDRERYNKIIDEETETLTKQADLCENNVNRHKTEDNLVAQDLPVVQFVARLNIHLYQYQAPRNGFIFSKGGIEFEDFDCNSRVRTLGLPQFNIPVAAARSINANIIRAVGGENITTKIGNMCGQLYRLHQCFDETETIIRDEDIDIYAVDRNSITPKEFWWSDVIDHYQNPGQVERNSSISN